MGTELLAGRLDAYVSMLGAPTPTLQNVESNEPITFLSLSPEQTKAVRKAMRRSTMQRSQSELTAPWTRTISPSESTILRSGRADLPDDLVYQLVKAAFDNQSRLFKNSFGGTRDHPAERG